MATIDIGPNPIDRDAGLDSSGLTVLDLTNPANGNGTITTIKIWAAANISNLKVGTFFGSPETYENRDFETIGSVTAGALRTYSSLNIDVQTGDFIGFYFTSGEIELTNNDGGGGLTYKSGDQFGQGEQSGYTSSGFEDWVVSLYGDNTAPPVDPTTSINIGDAWKSIAALKINIGDAWKAVAAMKINIGDAWKALDIT